MAMIKPLANAYSDFSGSWNIWNVTVILYHQEGNWTIHSRCHYRIDRLIALHWVRTLTVTMHLGLIDGPFVPHNLISTQDSRVPLPNFQMASKLKTFMSSGSKKGTQIYSPFLSKIPGKRIPSRFPNGNPIERDSRLQIIFTYLFILDVIKGCRMLLQTTGTLLYLTPTITRNTVSRDGRRRHSNLPIVVIYVFKFNVLTLCHIFNHRKKMLEIFSFSSQTSVTARTHVVYGWLSSRGVVTSVCCKIQ
jgi:hypothetical protein